MTDQSNIYPVNSEIFENCERELIEKLPSLYPNGIECEAVKLTLVPQLRHRIVRILSEFNDSRQVLVNRPLGQREIPLLCDVVGRELKSDQNLFVPWNLWEPMLNYIHSVREPIRDKILNEFKGYQSDLLDLQAKGDASRMLLKAYSGKNSLAHVFERGNMDVSSENHCNESNVMPEAEMEKILKALAAHGIVDLISLMEKGVGEFVDMSSDFPPYGSGRKFLSHIFPGEKVDYITYGHMRRISLVLGWGDPGRSNGFYVRNGRVNDLSKPKPTKENILKALSEQGIVDCKTLEAKGIVWFRSSQSQFPPFGSGRMLLSKVLGTTVKSVNLEHFRKLAQYLGWIEE